MNQRPFRVCPRCGKPYDKPPSLSRTDHVTYICPTCGFFEAIEEWAGKLKPRSAWKHPAPPDKD